MRTKRVDRIQGQVMEQDEVFLVLTSVQMEIRKLEGNKYQILCLFNLCAFLFLELSRGKGRKESCLLNTLQRDSSLLSGRSQQVL
jgi:hypothetical protein